MQVRSLGWEDPLEEGMAIHSRSLGSKVPWTEEPGGLKSMGSESDRTEATAPTSHACIECILAMVCDKIR